MFAISLNVKLSPKSESESDWFFPSLFCAFTTAVLVGNLVCSFWFLTTLCNDNTTLFVNCVLAQYVSECYTIPQFILNVILYSYFMSTLIHTYPFKWTYNIFTLSKFIKYFYTLLVHLSSKVHKNSLILWVHQSPVHLCFIQSEIFVFPEQFRVTI